jgi:hypothetical protein
MTRMRATGHAVATFRSSMGTVVALAALVAVGLTTPGAAQQRAAGDWTQWRGPARDGSVGAFAVPAMWPERLTQRWKVDVGLGYATPLIVGNRIYMFARQGDREVMSALDAESGKVLWSTGHTAVYPCVFERQAVLDRHDRHRHRLRCGFGQTAVAASWIDAAPALYDARVLADRGR